jgi:hypothetical protein
MVALARERFPQVADNLREKDLFSVEPSQSSFDWVVCSGSLNYGHDQAAYEQAIRLMFSLAKIGAAFNVLSIYADFMEAGYFYASPEETFRFCRTLTPWVTLIHDYMPHDFTVILRRERQVYD